jgi:cytochrome P450
MALPTNHEELPMVSAAQPLPPGPGIIESLRYLARFRTGDMQAYERLFERYGDVVRLRCPGHEDVVLAFHPDHIHHVLCESHRNYPKGKRYHELAPVLGMGLVNSEGELWRRQRRLVQSQFSSKGTLGLIPLINRHTSELLARWDAQGGEFRRDINDDMLEVSFNIAGEAFFGTALREHTALIRESFKYALSVALRRMYSPLPLPLGWPLPSHRRFQRAMRQIHDVIDRIIESYQRSEAPPGDSTPGNAADNVLARLLTAVDPETGERMSHVQLRDEIKTILMVGHETSSVTAAWALYLLAKHPRERARLVTEIDTVLGGREPEAPDLERMPYLDMVFHECLRCLPSVPFILRSPLADDMLGKYRIKAGSTLAIAPWVTHRHPEFWSEPLAFKPERFENGVKSLRHKLSYLPFGAGHRICLGELMGAVEGKILVTRLLQRYELTLAPGFEPRCRGFISLQPVGGMLMTCKRRALGLPSPERARETGLDAATHPARDLPSLA